MALPRNASLEGVISTLGTVIATFPDNFLIEPAIDALEMVINTVSSLGRSGVYEEVFITSLLLLLLLLSSETYFSGFQLSEVGEIRINFVHHFEHIDGVVFSGTSIFEDCEVAMNLCRTVITDELANLRHLDRAEVT